MRDPVKIPVIVRTAIDQSGCGEYHDVMTIDRMVAKITDLIRRRGMTQEAFERATALPRNRVSKWVSGQGEPTARQLWRIAQALGTTLEYLLDDSALESELAPRTDMELAYALVRKLGGDEAIRRLTRSDQYHGDTDYAHGQRVESPVVERRRKES